MSETNSEVASLRLGLTADTVAVAILIVWGLAYLMTAVLKPGVVGNTSVALSAAAMGLLGVLFLASVFLGSRLLFGLLALVEVGSMVGSWVGAIRWAVPYGEGVAAVSMAAADFVVAVVLVYKTIQLTDDVLAALDR